MPPRGPSSPHRSPPCKSTYCHPPFAPPTCNIAPKLSDLRARPTQDSLPDPHLGKLPPSGPPTPQPAPASSYSPHNTLDPPLPPNDLFPSWRGTRTSTSPCSPGLLPPALQTMGHSRQEWVRGMESMGHPLDPLFLGSPLAKVPPRGFSAHPKVGQRGPPRGPPEEPPGALAIFLFPRAAAAAAIQPGRHVVPERTTPSPAPRRSQSAAREGEMGRGRAWCPRPLPPRALLAGIRHKCNRCSRTSAAN